MGFLQNTYIQSWMEPWYNARHYGEGIMYEKLRGNVKMGEDIGTQTPDVSNTIEHILAEPLNLQEGTRKYHGRKTKAAVHKTQHQH